MIGLNTGEEGRMIREAAGALWAAVLASAAAACCGRPAPLLVAVPDASQRITVAIPADSAEARAAVVALSAEMACLVGSPQADARACALAPSEGPTCTTRRDATVRALQPLLDALPDIRLTTPIVTEEALVQRFPGFRVATREVRDARRLLRCDTWFEGKCVGLSVKDVWVLLRADSGSERVDTVEVFLGRENLCDRSAAPRT